MLFAGYNIHSNLVASRSTHSGMLDFAARHGVRPTIEKFEFSEEGFAEAVKKVKDGSIRYRAVLEAK
jgi:D-arabinose 1-dehydrogenase-like Zn-dependent alcohol dehydrogenase